MSDKKGPGGRPSTYTEGLADIICERLACGESMRSISRDDAMPAISTMFKWIREIPEFSQQYAKAKQESADVFAEDIVDIADNVEGNAVFIDGEPLVVDGKEVRSIDGPSVAHARLKVDARKWAASKLKPKKYGEKLELSGDQDAPVATVTMSQDQYKAARKEMLKEDDC